MKAATERKELREQSIEALNKSVREKEEELMKLKFRHANGQLQQSANLKNIKRSIARAKFVVSEKLSATEENS